MWNLNFHFTRLTKICYNEKRTNVRDYKWEEQCMSKKMEETICANGIDIGIYTTDYNNDFISLTDIARKREGE